MRHSENINELATALSKAQGEIEDATKDAENTFFKTAGGKGSKYATLAAVLQEIRPKFSKYGLSLVQTPWTNKDNNGAYTMTTTIMHSSGQFISGDLELILDKGNMQAMGSAISYSRRYMASAMAGVSQEDDDGNAASQSVSNHPQPKTAPPQQRPGQQQASRIPVPTPPPMNLPPLPMSDPKAEPPPNMPMTPPPFPKNAQPKNYAPGSAAR